MKVLIKAALGIVFGAFLFWFAISHVDMTDVRSSLNGAKVSPIILALAVYWTAFAVRAFRWRILLSASAILGFTQVAQALVVGYAANNVLPARLGEFFRADYLRRRFGVARTAALASIIVERLLDALIVLVLLVFGLLTARLKPEQAILSTAAWLASAVIAAGIAFVLISVFWHDRLPLDRWPWLRDRVAVFAQAMSIVHRPIMLIAVAASAVVWLLEMGTLMLILSGFNLGFDISGVCLIIGVATFSTLLPSAPGYVGSLQVGYMLAFSALNIAPVFAIVISTATQILLLGSVTLGGLVIYLGDELYRAAISAKDRAKRAG